jgi:putative aldouronate transport system permease protein
MFDLLNYIVLAGFAVACLFPLVYLTLTSFATSAEVDRGALVPRQFTLNAYVGVLSMRNFVQSFQVSVLVTTIGVMLNLSLTALMAYALARRDLPGRRWLTLFVVMTMMVNAGIIPLYLVVKSLGMINTIWSLIIPSAVSGFNVILMRNFFAAIPEELEDAARLDGCGDFGVFFRIMLPLSVPALAAFGLFAGVAYWNAYFNALMFINDQSLQPLQVVVRQILTVETSTGGVLDTLVDQRPYAQTLKAAVVILSIVPVLVVYPWLQRFFVRGVLVGSIKG